jgi:hypothetical protein
VPGPKSEEIHGFGATLTIGHAVFYMLLGYTGRLGMRMRYDAAIALKEIWPNPRDLLEWPAPLSLSESQIGSLAKYVEGNSVIRSE